MNANTYNCFSRKTRARNLHSFLFPNHTKSIPTNLNTLHQLTISLRTQAANLLKSTWFLQQRLVESNKRAAVGGQNRVVIRWGEDQNVESVFSTLSCWHRNFLLSASRPSTWYLCAIPTKLIANSIVHHSCHMHHYTSVSKIPAPPRQRSRWSRSRSKWTRTDQRWASLWTRGSGRRESTCGLESACCQSWW